MTDRPFGFGIIGCGWVAPAHAWGVKSLAPEGVDLVAVADLDPERASGIAERFGVPAVYNDYRELLADPTIDAVSVCLPDFLHRDAVIAAAEAGKHILCEKPLALDTGSADEMLEACRQNGVQLSMVMNHRYAVGNIQARSAVRAGLLGQQLFGSVVHSSGLKGDPDNPSDWRGRRGLATGGVLSTQAIHFLDLLLWFLGPVASVAAVTRELASSDEDFEDTVVLALEMRSGAVATLATTNGSPIMNDFDGTRIEVHGTVGWMMLEGDKVRFLETSEPYEPFIVERSAPPLGSEEVIFGDGHIFQIQDFVRSLRRGEPVPVPGSDARHLLAVIEAATVSSREERRVHVDSDTSGYPMN